MSFLNLDDLPLLSVAGHTLNAEERSALQHSLLLLKDNEKLDSAHFWGKIFGVQKDYLVAQATFPNETVFKRKFYYSLDAFNWLQLPQLTAEEFRAASELHNRLTGDPAYEYTLKEDQKITEERRLSAVVHNIHNDCEVVPRGAYYKNPEQQVLLNPTFSGLKKHEVDDVANYLHFRAGFEVTPKLLSSKGDKFVEHIDIFDSIANDQPAGVWTLRLEKNNSVAFLRSLQWPGYVFYHSPANTGFYHPFHAGSSYPAASTNYAGFGNLNGVIGNGKFGGVYFGSGQKNVNIGFML